MIWNKLSNNVWEWNVISSNINIFKGDFLNEYNGKGKVQQTHEILHLAFWIRMIVYAD